VLSFHDRGLMFSNGDVRYGSLQSLVLHRDPIRIDWGRLGWNQGGTLVREGATFRLPSKNSLRGQASVLLGLLHALPHLLDLLSFLLLLLHEPCRGPWNHALVFHLHVIFLQLQVAEELETAPVQKLVDDYHEDLRPGDSTVEPRSRPHLECGRANLVEPQDDRNQPLQTVEVVYCVDLPEKWTAYGSVAGPGWFCESNHGSGGSVFLWFTV